MWEARKKKDKHAHTHTLYSTHSYKMTVKAEILLKVSGEANGTEIPDILQMAVESFVCCCLCFFFFSFFPLEEVSMLVSQVVEGDLLMGVCVCPVIPLSASKAVLS